MEISTIAGLVTHILYAVARQNEPSGMAQQILPECSSDSSGLLVTTLCALFADFNAVPFHSHFLKISKGTMDLP